jgi:hypothetical protein
VKDAAFVSARCTRRHTSAPGGQAPRAQAGATTLAAVGDNGTYTGTLFSNQAVLAVHEHAAMYADQPLFMYFAMHDTHAPLEVSSCADSRALLSFSKAGRACDNRDSDACILFLTQAPWKYVAPYAQQYPADLNRAIFSGMLAFVDASVKNLTSALKETGCDYFSVIESGALIVPSTSSRSLPKTVRCAVHAGCGRTRSTSGQTTTVLQCLWAGRITLSVAAKAVTGKVAPACPHLSRGGSSRLHKGGRSTTVSFISPTGTSRVWPLLRPSSDARAVQSTARRQVGH